MIGADTLYAVLQYSLDEYPWPALISDLLGEQHLERLDGAGVPLHKRETDQKTKWHERFYAARELWEPAYRKFVMGFVARQWREDFYVQAIPTFRVQLPRNVAVGEFHRDSDYGHPAGSVNWWVPVTVAHQTSALWIYDAGGKRHTSAYPGDVIVFDGATRLHGNMVNSTGLSRVSFDFRVLPVRLYRETEARSINMGKRFAPGEYYAAEPVRGRG